MNPLSPPPSSPIVTCLPSRCNRRGTAAQGAQEDELNAGAGSSVSSRHPLTVLMSLDRCAVFLLCWPSLPLEMLSPLGFPAFSPATLSEVLPRGPLPERCHFCVLTLSPLATKPTPTASIIRVRSLEWYLGPDLFQWPRGHFLFEILKASQSCLTHTYTPRLLATFSASRTGPTVCTNPKSSLIPFLLHILLLITKS